MKILNDIMKILKNFVLINTSKFEKKQNQKILTFKRAIMNDLKYVNKEIRKL